MTEMFYTLGTWNWLIFGLQLLMFAVFAAAAVPLWRRVAR
ncbi:MAG TPA: NfeD family protein, partial [Bradyrhizobium sp.]|nr:NfeD family protein [Bradyrhizobium sp.]